MTLPIARNQTYVPGLSAVDSADLNEFQDRAAGILPFFLDDFYFLNGDMWTLTQTASGASAVVHNFHQLRLTTDASILHEAQLQSQGTLGQMPFLPAIRMRVMFLTAVSSRLDWMGLGDGFVSYLGGTNFPALAFARSSAIAGGHFELLVLGGAGLETFDTGFAPAANTFYVLTAVPLSASQIFWRISLTENGDPIASATVDLASPISVLTLIDLAGLFFTKNLTNAARTLVVDYLAVAPSTAAGFLRP